MKKKSKEALSRMEEIQIPPKFIDLFEEDNPTDYGFPVNIQELNIYNHEFSHLTEQLEGISEFFFH